MIWERRMRYTFEGGKHVLATFATFETTAEYHQTQDEMVAWATEQFGPCERVCRSDRWTYLGLVFSFTREADAVAFKVRWWC